MQWKPNVTVAAIISMDNRYLLVEELSKAGPTVYNQPAGHLEKGETLIDAIKREVLEETARQFEPEYLTGIYLCPDSIARKTYLRFCFYGRCSNFDEHRKLDRGIVSNVWMTLEEMESVVTRMRTPLVMRCLRDYLSGQAYPLEILSDLFPAGNQ